VHEQVRGLAPRYREVVLSGVNLGRWGRDRSESLVAENTARSSLAGLVRQIIEQTSLERLRLSSIEPMDWDEELIGLMAEFGGTRLARHAHLPLQSGSDRVLDRMKRKYTTSLYKSRISTIRSLMPHACIAADVIVGFTGETEEDFAETLYFLEQLDITLSIEKAAYFARRIKSPKEPIK